MKKIQLFGLLMFMSLGLMAQLSKPKLIMGKTGPVKTGGHGLAHPAVYDWNKDGKKDLIIGEFEHHAKFRVYLNIGTDAKPKFSDDWFYGKGANGKDLFVETGWCIGFTPQFVDLDNDGYTDILSGKYNPNDVTWFRGSKDGFFEGVILKEEREKLAKGERRLDELMKTLKCSPVFVDIDGDKDLDMFVTGFNKVRLNINVGTPEYPKFGKREYVSTVSGKLVESSHSTLAVVDWDGDNILDLVLTDGYYNKGDVGLKYYKGLGKGKYADAKPIFKNKDGIKYISGRSYWICSTDWNNDGKTDFLIGSCITTKDGKILKDLNNKVEVRKKRTKEEKAQYMKEKAKLLEGTKGYGYVYLLLRKK